MDNNSAFVPASREHRSLTLEEATKALSLERDRTRMVSWMTPYFSQIVDAIKKGRERVILNGREFKIAAMRNFPGEYSIMPTLDQTALPCAVFKLESLEKASVDGTAY